MCVPATTTTTTVATVTDTSTTLTLTATATALPELSRRPSDVSERAAATERDHIYKRITAASDSSSRSRSLEQTDSETHA